MESKKLRKSNDKMISGVCAGIAEYLGWQASMVRLITVVATFLGASGILIYIILYFVMPNPETPEL